MGDLHGCPLSFDQVPCGTPLGQVGLCNDDRLLYNFAEDLPGMVGNYPLWMCFYDHATGQLIGQRVCLSDARACGDWYCVDTPGTPNCDDYITTLATPACADAGTTD